MKIFKILIPRFFLPSVILGFFLALCLRLLAISSGTLQIMQAIWPGACLITFSGHSFPKILRGPNIVWLTIGLVLEVL